MEGEPRPISKGDLAKLATTAKVAGKSQHHRFRVGATVWKGGRILGASPNVCRGGPDVPPGRFSVHAEVACINMASSTRSFRGATLYVVRLDAADYCTNSRPCSYCMDFLGSHNLQRIIYSAENGKFECITL